MRSTGLIWICLTYARCTSIYLLKTTWGHFREYIFKYITRRKTFNYTTLLYFYNIIDTSTKQSEQSQNMADLSAGYDHKQEKIRSN